MVKADKKTINIKREIFTFDADTVQGLLKKAFGDHLIAHGQISREDFPNLNVVFEVNQHGPRFEVKVLGVLEQVEQQPDVPRPTIN